MAAEASHPSLGIGRGLGIGSANRVPAPTPIFHGEMNVTNVKPPNLLVPLESLPAAATTPTATTIATTTAVTTPTTDM